MKKYSDKYLCIGVFAIVLFVIWTILLCFVDVKTIGPNNSTVGFSAINKIFHDFTGVNFTLYVVTDWLGLVPFAVMFGFAVFGFLQLIKRKNILKVDYNILMLGGFYFIVFAVYLLFEIFVINYRPVLINGVLEASYPSSTTMLVMCVMPSAVIQLNVRVKKCFFRVLIAIVFTVFTIFMVFARLFSGVHWLTDIVGGIFISFGLVTIYKYFCRKY